MKSSLHGYFRAKTVSSTSKGDKGSAKKDESKKSTPKKAGRGETSDLKGL